MANPNPKNTAHRDTEETRRTGDGTLVQGVTGGMLDDATLGFGADKDGNAPRKASNVTGATGGTVGRAGVSADSAELATAESDPGGDSDLGAPPSENEYGQAAARETDDQGAAIPLARDLDGRPATEPNVGTSDKLTRRPTGERGAEPISDVGHNSAQVNEDLRTLLDAGEYGSGDGPGSFDTTQMRDIAEHDETVPEVAAERDDLPADETRRERDRSR